MHSRFEFVRLVGGAPLVASASVAPRTTPTFDPQDRLSGALVLSGGGALGAYEAGVVAALVAAAGVADGEPLPMFQAVLGTSIGSINAYLVATAQYAKLAALWHGIAAANLFALQPRFAKIVETSSGVFDRLFQALALEAGLVTNVRGILERERIAAVIEGIVGADRPPLVPLLFTATNLSDERADVFFRSPVPVRAADVAAGEAALQRVVGPGSRAHEAVGALLPRALLASAALPVLFDPVELRFDGVTSQYVDGGIADNTPIDIAAIIAKGIYAVLVEPLQPRHQLYGNALEIGVAAFGVAQRRILDSALRTLAIASENSAHASALFAIRPASDLALTFTAFNSQAAIDAVYARGVADGAAGWRPYRRPVGT